ncbi:MAG: peptidoglycan-binding protein [Oscillospiraceae bacterium]|jgi:g-D-glutamyl-meso-diaminopimelate peptidase|nr:peptidoglycan-binding protein [Oscillospiraceae bacterium]
MDGLRTLHQGDRTPQTDLLQIALTRAGFAAEPDGVFGAKTAAAVRRFQISRGLVSDGIVGNSTWRALNPYLVGYLAHTVVRGDTLYKIAAANGSTIAAIETANPSVNSNNLQVGAKVTVPLWFDVVPTDIRQSSALNRIIADGLAKRYPFLGVSSAGKSVMGRDLLVVTLGNGANEVFYNAAHHANEWITSTLLWKFAEDYAQAYASGGAVYGIDARSLFSTTTLYLAPMVNPDGVDLVNGEVNSGDYYQSAKNIANSFPQIPFPAGWKANIRGVDPNLQYPAGWERAREIKFAQGFTSPAPRDYVGTRPLEAPESRAVYDFTLEHDFSLTLSYHTQGEVIYWQYGEVDPPRALEIGREFARLSGYSLEITPAASSNAGYKDWFIDKFLHPGYTIEVGLGVPPIPTSQFEEIYRKNRGILTVGLTITA